MHRHRPTAVVQHETVHTNQAEHHRHGRYQPHIPRCRSEDSGQSVPKPRPTRHAAVVAAVRPRHRTRVAGDQKKHRNRLERPRQPLRPGLIDERVLPTEVSVAVRDAARQPVPQHDEDHARDAVAVHRKLAGGPHGAGLRHQRSPAGSGSGASPNRDNASVPATATTNPTTTSQPKPARVRSPSQATPTSAGPIVSPTTIPATAVVTDPRLSAEVSNKNPAAPPANTA